MAAHFGSALCGATLVDVKCNLHCRNSSTPGRLAPDHPLPGRGPSPAQQGPGRWLCEEFLHVGLKDLLARGMLVHKGFLYLQVGPIRQGSAWDDGSEPPRRLRRQIDGG